MVHDATRAQANEVFLYIITIVVVGMVLLFGYQAIMSLKKTGDKAAVLDVADALQNAVDRNSAFGRVGVEDFSVPQEFTSICFIDAQLYGSPSPDLSGVNAFVADAVASNSRDKALGGEVENIFLLRQEGAPEGVITDPLTVSSGFLCESVQGKLKLRMEGRGSSTVVGVST